MGKSAKAPKAPDPVVVANAQSAANKETAIAEAQLGNPNVTTPQGSQTVAYRTDPLTGNPVPYISQTFSPDQQAIFDLDEKLQLSSGMLGQEVLGNVSGALRQPLSFSGAPSMPGSADATRKSVIDAMMSRVGTDLDRKRGQTNSQLVAAGLAPGTEAYAREMEAIDRQENDARQQAILAGGAEAQRDFGMDMQSRQQAISEILGQRQTPLNELSALRSGSQVAPLQFQGVNAPGVGQTPIAQAMQNQYQGQLDQYNANVGQQNSTMGTLGALGGAAMMATGMF